MGKYTNLTVVVHSSSAGEVRGGTDLHARTDVLGASIQARGARAGGARARGRRRGAASSGARAGWSCASAACARRSATTGTSWRSCPAAPGRPPRTPPAMRPRLPPSQLRSWMQQ